jgi:hypothetical protein
MEPDLVKSVEPDKALTKSLEEMEGTIAAYQKLVIDQEKIIKWLAEQDLATTMLVTHQDTYRMALFIEAGLRLMILLFLWILIALKSGFSLTNVLLALATVVFYLGLELLDISDKMRRVKKAIYR